MGNNSATEPVVVGVDFSKDNSAAVDAAAAQAERRGVPLELVHAVEPTLSPRSAVVWTMDEIRQAAERDLSELAATVTRDHPGLEVRHRFLTQTPTAALVEASRRAPLVVLGSRGQGGFAQLLLGSVAWRVACRAHGPVLLVRSGESAGAAGPVVVGVDGSTGSQAALEFALGEASLRGVDLVAVNVWGLLSPHGLGVGREAPADADGWERQAEAEGDRVLSEALAGAAESHPDVTVQRVVKHGFNVPVALLDVAAAKGADLVVVGARGSHAVADLVLGAVGVQLSHHADRSVAVVHAQAAP